MQGTFASAAQAAEEVPFTLSKSAVNAANTPITAAQAGDIFFYNVEVGCVASGACSGTAADPGVITVKDYLPAELEVQTPLTTPSGGTVQVLAPGAAGNDSATQTLVIATFTDLTLQSTIVSIPVKAPADLDYSHNGTVLTNIATAVATMPGVDETTKTSSVDITLDVPQVPGITAATKTWSPSNVTSGSGAEPVSTITARATANTVSSITIYDPDPDASATVANAFDLQEIELNQNPGGATVSWIMADGTVEAQVLSPGTLTATAPSATETLGFRVKVNDIPGPGSTQAERTVIAKATWKLRDTLRDSGDPVVQSGNSTSYKNTFVASNSVASPAPGKPSSASLHNQAAINVQLQTADISISKSYPTANGDQTSVIGSGEAATATINFANTGGAALNSLTVTEPAVNSAALSFQELTVEPIVTFPQGATSASVTYTYADSGAEVIGDPQAFSLGDTVPGVESGYTLDQVIRVAVTFTGSIVGNCANVDTASCAGSLVVPTKLRNANEKTGQTIVANTSIQNVASYSYVATSSANGNGDSNSVTITTVAPQFRATSAKAIEDNQIAYPLTGVAQAGDYWDTEEPQNGADAWVTHPLKLRAGSEATLANPQPDQVGPESLRVQDPVITSAATALSGLSSNVFDKVQLTSIGTAAPTCVAADESTSVPATLSLSVWVVDVIPSPTSVTLVPYDASIDLEKIVGLDYTVTPVGASTFPLEVDCALPESAVKWRTHSINDGSLVQPAGTDGSTPGLLNAINVARVTATASKPTETATPLTSTAQSQDSLYLVDLVTASGMKQVTGVKTAVWGQGTTTKFRVAGMVPDEHTVKAWIVDGGTAHSAFDMFALTGLQNVHIGPDQTMKFALYDKDGDLLTGANGVISATVSAPALGDAAANEDSQSAGYIAAFSASRSVTWTNFDASALAHVYKLVATVTRTSDPTTELQKFGGFNFELTATLRDKYLSDGAIIVGSSAGQIYDSANCSTVHVSDDPNAAESTGGTTSSCVPFTIYTVEGLTIESSIDWSHTSAMGADDNTLVAEDGTASLVRVGADNKSYVGPSWDSAEATAVGVDSLSAGVGTAAGNTEADNPFALVSFTGITGIVWPIRFGATGTVAANDAANRVAGSITYTFADGSTEVVPAPVGASSATLNPTAGALADVVGVSIVFAENGKLVGQRAKTNLTTPQGSFTFGTTLRDIVRTGYSIALTQTAGGTTTPIIVNSGDEIAPGSTTVWTAVFTGQASGAGNLLVDGNPTATTKTVDSSSATVNNMTGDPINIVPKTYAVSADKQNTSMNPLYRDRLPQTQWTTKVTNAGDGTVDSMRIADTDALYPGTWSRTTTTPSSDSAHAAYPNVSASDIEVFDATDFLSLSVTLPVNAASAYVWFRTADGSWSDPVNAVVNGTVSLPAGVAAADVVGYRVEFVAGANRMAKGAVGTVVLNTKLREYLRSDAGERSPASETAATGPAQWTIVNSAQTAVLRNLPTGNTEEVSDPVSVSATTLPGAPMPTVKKWVAVMNGSSAVANPGVYTDFFLVLSNPSNATGGLYNLKLVDTLPTDLVYDPSHPASVVAENSAAGIVDPTTSVSGSQITFTWPDSSAPAQKNWLNPGEQVVVKVPLRFADDADFSSGIAATNHVEAFGSGAVAGTSRCENGAAGNDSNCVSEASLTLASMGSVRIEKFIETGTLGAVAQEGSSYDCTAPAGNAAYAHWNDSYWAKNPCVVQSIPGTEVTYRLQLINNGTKPLETLRFADELSAIGDAGVLLPSQRNSDWTGEYVPGSLRLVTDLGSGAASGLRADATAAFQYSDTQNACSLLNATGGTNTLACGAGTWSMSGTTTTRAVKGDVSFGSNRLQPGEYVVVEFSVKLPEVVADQGTDGRMIGWNSAALTARETAAAQWYSAGESPNTGAEPRYADVTVSKRLAGAMAEYHLQTGTQFAVAYTCEVPGGGATPLTGTLMFAAPAVVNGETTATIEDVPVGWECIIDDESYAPVGYTDTPNHYGTVTANDAVAGYEMSVEYAEDQANDELTVAFDPDDNTIDVTNTFADTSLKVIKEVSADNIELPAGMEYHFDVVCTFGGQDVYTGTADLADGEFTTVSAIPVGASCEATESGGASANTTLSAELDGVNRGISGLTASFANLDADTASDPLEATMTNTFTAAADLVVTKQLERPSAGVAVSDFEFQAVCSFGGEDYAVKTHQVRWDTDPASRVWRISGLPVGAKCAISESDSGQADDTSASGGDVAAQVATVTAAASEQNVVLTNTFFEAQLALTKQLAGTAAQLDWVPRDYTFYAVCTREITLDGSAVTATDFSGAVQVAVGSATVLKDLPRGSKCVVTEPENLGAQATSLAVITGTGTNASDADPAATVTLDGVGAQSAAIEVTNTFEAVSLTVSKRVTGGTADPGAEYGFALSCTAPELAAVAVAQQTSNDGAFKLTADESITFELPIDSDCVVTETDDGGAQSVLINDGNGKSATGKVALQSTDVELVFTNVFADQPALKLTGGQQLSMLFGVALLLGGAALLLFPLRRRILRAKTQ